MSLKEESKFWDEYTDFLTREGESLLINERRRSIIPAYWANRGVEAILISNVMRCLFSLCKKDVVAIDVGCGMGWLTVRLARHCEYVVGIDISSHRVKGARSYANKRGAFVDFVLGDVQCMPFRARSFDLIVNWAVLHHIPQVENCVEQQKGLLKQNGKAFIWEHHFRPRFMYKLNIPLRPISILANLWRCKSPSSPREDISAVIWLKAVKKHFRIQREVRAIAMVDLILNPLVPFFSADSRFLRMVARFIKVLDDLMLRLSPGLGDFCCVVVSSQKSQ